MVGAVGEPLGTRSERKDHDKSGSRNPIFISALHRGGISVGALVQQDKGHLDVAFHGLVRHLALLEEGPASPLQTLQ